MPTLESRIDEALNAITDRRELLEFLELTEEFAIEGEHKLELYEPTSEIAEKFHLSPARVRALTSGNRAGKTTILSVEVLIQVTGIVPESLRGRYPQRRISVPGFARLDGVDYETGVKKLLRPKVLAWLPEHLFDRYDTDAHILYLTNGSIIEFLTYAQPIEKHGGTARHVIGCDEIPPPDVVKESKMRLVDYGGDLLFSFTPYRHDRDQRGQVTNNAIAIAHFYDEYYLKASKIYSERKDGSVKLYENPFGAKHIEIFRINVYKNKHINQQQLREDAEGMNESDRKTRIEGEFQHLSGLVYGDEYDPQLHIVHDFKVGVDWPVYCAIDPHPSIPHHVSYYAVDPHGRGCICGEIKMKGTAGELAAAMYQLEKYHAWYIMWRLIDPNAFDPDMTTGMRFAENMVVDEIGMILRPGSKELLTGIYAVKDALKGQQLFISDKCTGHIWELQRYVWDKDGKPADKDDHYMENTRRLVMSRPYYISVRRYQEEVNKPINAPTF